MPIIARNPEACFEQFRAHVADLVASTLPIFDTIRVRAPEKSDPPRAILEFARGLVGLETKEGPVYLALAQLLVAERLERRKHRLRTLKYWYRLHGTPEGDALVRWEYDPDVLPRCRHHVHLQQVRIPLGAGEIDLTRMHLPTGWVTLEEVIRFLIAEPSADG